MDLIHFLETHLFSCSVKSLTGLNCPGCGMQRAMIALLRGDLPGSLSCNPTLIPFLVTLLYSGLHLFFSFRHGARNTVIFFAFTGSLMIANFVVKLLYPQ
jgi:hypothetical protein